MAFKPLSFEGRFECNMDAVVKGKVWAFVAVMPTATEPQYGLGLAVANEPGYNPIPTVWVWADTYDEMDAHADALNQKEGLTPIEAAKIVLSTMKTIPRRGT